MTDMPKLDVVGVGPQKTASTWLYKMLSHHPGICFPQGVKETFFWDKNYRRGQDWYFAHFDHCQGSGLLKAEIGPTYFSCHQAAERIYKHNKECKVIVTLRSPVDRSFSLYLHHRKKGRINCDFFQAIEKIPEIIEGSRYSIHLPTWIEYFRFQNVHVIIQDDVLTTPQAELEKTLRFLGLSDIKDNISVGEKVNAASWPRSYLLAKTSTLAAGVLRKAGLYSVVNFAKKIGLKDAVYKGNEQVQPSMSEDVSRYLSECFDEEVSYIEHYLGRNLDAWRL